MSEAIHTWDIETYFSLQSAVISHSLKSGLKTTRFWFVTQAGLATLKALPAYYAVLYKHSYTALVWTKYAIRKHLLARELKIFTSNYSAILLYLFGIQWDLILACASEEPRVENYIYIEHLCMGSSTSAVVSPLLSRSCSAILITVNEGLLRYDPRIFEDAY